jgi:hypothetical protein
LDSEIVLLYFLSEQTVFARDLETIPDIAAAARMLDLGTAPEAEVREALGPGFPKRPFTRSSASVP